MRDRSLIRGGVGCKRCSSSASCVGRVYVCALLLRCYVFLSTRVLALVSLSFQVFNKESSSGAAVHGLVGMSPPPIGRMLVPLPGSTAQQ